MDRYPGNDPEIWEPDDSGRLAPLTDRNRVAAGGHTTSRAGLGRLGVSVPGAVIGSFLVATLAFGAAGGLRLATQPSADANGTTGADGTNGASAAGAGGPGQALFHLGDGGTTDAPDKPDAIDQQPDASDGTDGTEPTDAAPDNRDADPTPKPDATEPAPDKPEPVVDPKPELHELELAAANRDGKVALDWSSCTTDGFRAYKLVRSGDERVTWPMGDDDALVTAIEDRTDTAHYDSKAPAGKPSWYRVFAFGSHAGESYLACRSELARVTTPDREPQPTPKPETGSLGLSLAIREGAVKVDWTVCGADAFAYYKVLRSSDSTISWPRGDNDTKVAGIESRDRTAILDDGAPAGRKVWYRVFCLNGEGRVLAASAAKSIVTPEKDATPKPETSAMEFGLAVTGDGIVLEWEACGGELFRYYKVVRSHSSNPSYLPWTDGSEVIAVIENAGTTRFVDTRVEPGETWFYRIQAIGAWEGEKVLLGRTAAKSVTLE